MMTASSVRVSILLPTYNRAAFLDEAFASIKAQTWRDWELVIVDDGSTDATRAIVESHHGSIDQHVVYVQQENAGAYAARNRALDLARGSYVAFFDSDDVWLPHHLGRCVAALDRNAGVDWIYGACRIEDIVSGQILQPNTFYVNGAPRPLLQLHADADGMLNVFDDTDTLRCAIAHGLFCGLQNSVIRRSVFAEYRFATALRNEAEDQIAVVRALSKGHRLAYFDDVHVVYRIHGDNSSASAAGASLEKRLFLYRALVQGWEELRESVSLTDREREALNQRLARELFWHIGYALLWHHGRRQEALAAFREGLALWPTNAQFWKTYVLAWVRTRARMRGL